MKNHDPRKTTTDCRWLQLTVGAMLVAALAIAPHGAEAQLAGTTVDIQSVNFPGTGAGQIILGDGPQNVGDSGLTVDTQVTALPNGDELVEFWWSNGRDNATTIADDPHLPSTVSFALGQPGQPAGVSVQFLLALTVDGEPQTPANPFQFPPLMNIGPHPHGRDFDVFIFDGLPQQGLQYDEQGRMTFTLPSGMFAGQTFYHRGDVPMEQGGVPGPLGDVGGLDIFGHGSQKDQINGIYNGRIIRQVPLQPGDADQDLDFDQFDLIQVHRAAKYLTGEPATWGEGDWNGAPAGGPGSPPAGDGIFDHSDIMAALSGGQYIAGSYLALQANGERSDSQTSIGYDAGTGEVWVDPPIGIELTSISIDSASEVFVGTAAQNLGGGFDNDADDNIFKATFGGSFGDISFGTVAQKGLDETFLVSDLTVSGSLAGGGQLGDVDLVYVPVPEPSTILLAVAGALCVCGIGRRRPR